ncbi:hypothetical protein V5O48_015619 [Marasmius crinis-equi]|uniref:Uncharacterized protein n=1 Tax=Marasmius crinis-equi TaxID=585013 RepID=A0ABR3EU21_9AGAR
MVIVVGTDRPKGKAQYNIALPSSSFLKKKVRTTKSKAHLGLSLKSLGLGKGVWTECDKMGKDFKRKRQYFEDMFYQGGVHLTKPRNSPSDYNAFLAVRAHERREAGLPPKPLLDLQTELSTEYHTLSEKQLVAIREKYNLIRDEDALERVKRPSMKEKAADVARSVTQIVGILRGLKIRVGIEAILCIVKNRAEKYMNAQWIQTDKRLGEYLEMTVRGFDMGLVGRKLEAFSVAGFDTAKVIKSSKEQAEQLKKDGTRLIQKQLDNACGTKNLTIQYPTFDTSITMTYRVVCEGWPSHLPFKPPSAYGTSLAPLIELVELWQNGTIRFRKLNAEEFNEWKVKRRERLESGELPPPKGRKKRSDAGVPRKRKGKQGENTSAAGEDEEHDADEDRGEDDDDELPEVAPVKPKTVKKAKTAPAEKPAPNRKPAKSAPKNKQVTKHCPEVQVEAAPEPDGSVPKPSNSGRPRPTPRRVVPQLANHGPTSSSNVAAGEDVEAGVPIINGATDSARSGLASDDVETDAPSNSLESDDRNIDPILRNLVHTASPLSSVPLDGDTTPGISKTQSTGRKRKALTDEREASVLSDGRDGSVIGEEGEEGEATGSGRSRRKRNPPKLRHLGASGHPALMRVFGKGNVNSDDDDGDS